MKGKQRNVSHSGKYFYPKLVVPEVLKPIRNGVYRVKLTSHDSEKGTCIYVEVRELINRS